MLAGNIHIVFIPNHAMNVSYTFNPDCWVEKQRLKLYKNPNVLKFGAASFISFILISTTPIGPVWARGPLPAAAGPALAEFARAWVRTTGSPKDDSPRLLL